MMTKLPKAIRIGLEDERTFVLNDPTFSTQELTYSSDMNKPNTLSTVMPSK